MGHARRASLASSAPFPLSSQEYFIARPLRITRHPARHQVTATKNPKRCKQATFLRPNASPKRASTHIIHPLRNTRPHRECLPAPDK
jgi:hypothetical protein